MRLTFQLRFHTRPGESLWLTGQHEIFGMGDPAKALPLHYHDAQNWRVTVILPRCAAPDVSISYDYLFRRADGSFIQDWGNDRTINPASLAADDALILDSWNNPGFAENAFYTEPFRQVLLKPKESEFNAHGPEKVTHTFRIKAPLLEKGQTLCLMGSVPALGRWRTEDPILLTRKPGGIFLTTGVDLAGQSFPIEYKYGVYDAEARKFIRYEGGTNRILAQAPAAESCTIVNDGFAVLPSETWRGAGVAIPVFSLRSEGSFGVGEFTDLKLMAEWCRTAGLKLIQILPVNDTTATHTWTDSYPYAAISAFALHPIYLSLRDLATGPERRLLAALEPERRRLNSLDHLDYDAVMQAKMGFLRQIYPARKAKTFRSRDYQRFFEWNKIWLVPYAVFCFLRDRYGAPDPDQWPEHRVFNSGAIEKMAAPGSAEHDEIAFSYFLQFHLHAQLEEASRYAHSQGVILKGDIPIGVSRSSADVWQQPELFHRDMQAGAPPDAFAAKGQNWSFPTYNWPRMKQDNFTWWKRRFEQMSVYFDAFRIDHILGFFRIWSIPMRAVEGVLGYFVPALPARPEEFAARGIVFDRNRCVLPFISESSLQDVFGPESGEIKTRFLDESRAERYALKPEFSTQRQVERYFAGLEDTEQNRRLKQGLYDLITNVLLIEAEGPEGRVYHFRFGMETTSSFKNLDPRGQAVFRELYVDYFYRRQENFWLGEAMQKLPALKRVTNMLICGEDLGMVPGCVPQALKDLGLLGLEVQRMPKRLNEEFSEPKNAAYLSVVTPSTHDMSTIRGWWKEDRAVTQTFYNRILGHPGRAPEDCPGSINKEILLQHLSSPAMWSIFQLQDLLGMDERLRRPNPDEERINVPANPGHYWQYRMHLTLEELLKQDTFNQDVKRCVAASGR